MTQGCHRIFVSFSARDTRTEVFATKLLQRLNDHRAKLAYMFFRLREDVDNGCDIEQVCRDEISNASLFVALVTADALNSAYTMLETEYALQNPPRDGLVVISSKDCGTATWAGPYSRLAKLKHVVLDFALGESVENATLLILGKSGIVYRPPAAEEPSFPFSRRLFEEVEPLIEGQGQFAATDLLRTVSQKISSAYISHQYEECRKQLNALETILQLQFPSHRFFYIKLAGFILQVQELETRNCRPSDLQKVLEAMQDWRSSLSKKEYDENLPAAVGYLHQALGAFEEALICYRQAEAMVVNGPDVDLAYNIIISQLNLGRQISFGEMERILGVCRGGVRSFSVADVTLLLALRSLCYASRGDGRGFIRSLSDWCERPESVRSDIMLSLMNALESFAHTSSEQKAAQLGIELLEKQLRKHTRDRADWFALQFSMGKCLFLVGLAEQAHACLKSLGAEFPMSPLPIVEVALQSLALGSMIACSSLHTVTRMNFESLEPQLKVGEFNYLVGAAWWLLGERTRAAFKYDETSGEAGEYYDELILRYRKVVERFSGEWFARH